MHSAFNLFVFPNYMFTSLLFFFNEYFLFIYLYIYILLYLLISGEIALKNNHYYYYYCYFLNSFKFDFCR